MKIFTSIIFAFLLSFAWGQSKDQKKIIKIVDEGKLLYRSEVASWLGTDIFLANYPNKEDISGYFSYPYGEATRCVFFDRSPVRQIIGTIQFDANFDKNNIQLDLTKRVFTEQERALFIIRQAALENIQTNLGDFYSFYSNSNPNIIPLIQGNEKKVYILTGPTIDGVVIFGNDYLLTFNKKGVLASRKVLHQNIITMEFTEESLKEDPRIAMHSHNKSTGNFITPTDVCTLLLYARAANWRMHYVITPKYLNIWDCESENLMLLPREAFNKINSERERSQKENSKD